MGNRQLIRGLIFDFDGTLIDSYEAIAESINHVRASFSLPPFPVEEIRPMVGHGLEHLIAKAIGPESVETLHNGIRGSRGFLASSNDVQRATDIPIRTS